MLLRNGIKMTSLGCPVCQTIPRELRWDNAIKRWQCLYCDAETRLRREYLATLPILSYDLFNHAGELLPVTLRLEINSKTRVWITELYDGYDSKYIFIQLHYNTDGWMVTDTFNR